MGMRIRLIALILYLYFPFLCLFKIKSESKFSQKLCKLESSNMVYICRMNDCIVGLRLRVMALILLFLSIFLSFLILHVNIQNLCVFSQELL